MGIGVVAVLIGLSLASFLTAKIVKALDMSDKNFFRLGVLFCVAAGASLVSLIFLQTDAGNLVYAGATLLCCFVFDLIATFRSKKEALPPFVAVNRPVKGRVARTAKSVAIVLLVGFVFYFAGKRSLPFLGQMSGLDSIACGLFMLAAIVTGFNRLIERDEICGNGSLDWVGSPPGFKPWEAYQSFSWTEETKDGLQLTLRPKSSRKGTTPFMVRLEDREVVRQILEANLPNELSGAHDGNNPRILPPCVPVRRTRRRRFARHALSVMCWPATVLLLVDLWKWSPSLEIFSGVGLVSIIITVAVNSSPSEIIEICSKGLLLDDKLQAWEEYECFYWKRQTGDGVELRLLSKDKSLTGLTSLVVTPEDYKTVQQLLEASLQDRTRDSEPYSGSPHFSE